MNRFRFELYGCNGQRLRSVDVFASDPSSATTQALAFIHWVPPSERAGGMSLWDDNTLLLALNHDGSIIP